MQCFTRERIAIVGPVPPFRGGIAQHTMMLSRALAELADVLVLSFSRQYPRWLYPGSSDIDPAATRMAGPECRFVLDSLGPPSWSRTVDAIAEYRASAVVIPWWSAYWAPCFMYLARRLARLRIPVHFHCHNVAGHDASGWETALAKRVLRSGSGFIVQSAAEKAQLLRWIPAARVAVVPHPLFSQYPVTLEPMPRRAELELLFFGFVRRYKGLEILLRALPAIRGRDFKLTVAGEFWEQRDEVRSLAEAPEIAGRVEIIDRYIGEEEAARLFSRADVLVMPYRSATGSGVLGLAYRYGVPVVASAVPGLAELVREGETGFLVEPGSVDDLAAALGRISPTGARAMKPAIDAFARTLTWDALARRVIGQVIDARVEDGGRGKPAS